MIRKIIIVFCLISVIPSLVFAYLMLPRLLTAEGYAGSMPAVILLTVVIVLLGFSLLLGISRNIARISMSANAISHGKNICACNAYGASGKIQLSPMFQQPCAS